MAVRKKIVPIFTQKTAELTVRKWQRTLNKIVEFEVRDHAGISIFLKGLASTFKQSKSLTEMDSKLEGYKKAINKFEYGLNIFGDRIEKSILAAYVIGLESVGVERAKKSFGEFEPSSYEEALEWFKEKDVLTSREFDVLVQKIQEGGYGYEEALHQAHQVAFTVTKQTAQLIVEGLRDNVYKALSEGTTLADFVEAQNSWLATAGFTDANRAYLETVYRTNVQSAYNTAHYREMSDPDILKITKFWQYVAIEDPRTSDICRAFHSTTLPADDPFWQSNFPPNHFNCRSTVIVILDIPSNAGIKATARPEGEADEGFRGIPGAGTDWS